MNELELLDQLKKIKTKLENKEKLTTLEHMLWVSYKSRLIWY